MKTKTRKTIKIVLFCICLIVFTIVTRMLLVNKVSAFDTYIYDLVIKLKCKPVTVFFLIITTMCSMWFVALLTALIMLFSKDKRKAFYIALNVLLCFLLNQIFKYTFTRERPIGINLINVRGYSFPSGHSMLSVAFYGFLAYLALHGKGSRRKRLLIISAFALLTLIIGISRIYLGVHYASDVLAGFVLSLAYLILFVSLLYNRKSKK